MVKVLVVAVFSVLLAVVACGYERPADVPGSADCGNGLVRGSELCDDGNTVDGDGCDSNCTLTECGNGIVTAGEACDDGNDIVGDGCDSCATSGCGDSSIGAGEDCDDGNMASGDGCDSNCTATGCGNGVQTFGEVCDDGNAADGDGCDSNCKPTGCGNGILTAGEVCDDGNLDNTDDCVGNCVAPRCGDTFVHAMNETCDDGNVVTDECPYGGTMTCSVCDMTCHIVAAQPRFCGDGIVQLANEVCDDGNLTCGTCSADCSTFASAKAVGTITVLKPTDLVDGDRFTLDDGINPPVTFEFRKMGAPAPGNIAIDLTGIFNASEVATRVHDKILEISQRFTPPLLGIAPTGKSGAIVNLQHVNPSSVGNRLITEIVADPDFIVSGMSGGAGGDCTAGQSCGLNADCLSNICVVATKVCQ